MIAFFLLGCVLSPLLTSASSLCYLEGLGDAEGGGEQNIRALRSVAGGHRYRLR